MKPGVRASEFWLSILGMFMPIVVAFGIVSQAEANDIVTAVTQFIAALAHVGAAFGPVVAYIKGRTELKK